MRRWPLLLLILLSSLFVYAQKDLQNAPSWDAVRNATRQKVEVRMTAGPRYKGQVRGVTDISMSLDKTPDTKTLERDDIDRVSRLYKSRKTGALWGLAIGAGSGAILGYAGTSNCRPGEFCTISRAGGTALGATVGGGLGAVTGALIGKTKRALLYLRPEPSQRGKPSPYVGK